MFLKIIDITLPIFAIALIGFVYSRRVKPDLASANKLVVDIALPMLIFTSLATKNFDPQAAIAFTGASVLLILVSGVLAWPVARFSGASARAFLPCVMFTNVGPVGIPLIVLAYGPEGLAPAVVLLVISNVLHFTVGAGVMSGRVDWRMVWANPLVWATLLGVSFSQFQLELPTALNTPLLMIGNVLVPMMLLSLGARLSSSQVSDIKVGAIASILTLVLRLLGTLLVLQIVPLQGVERGALVLFACLPSAVFNFMLADRFQVEPSKVASMVIVGHFFSVLFLPLAIWIAFQI